MRKSLLEDRPDLLSEWSEKNLPLTPADVSAHSERPVWWKCDQGHEWIAPIQNRNGKNRTGCPYCGVNATLILDHSDTEKVYH